MAQYDIPAMINYTLNFTGMQKLAYAGHSEGTTIMFAGGAINPNLAEQVAIFFGLAPATSTYHTGSIWQGDRVFV